MIINLTIIMYWEYFHPETILRKVNLKVTYQSKHKGYSHLKRGGGGGVNEKGEKQFFKTGIICTRIGRGLLSSFFS